MMVDKEGVHICFCLNGEKEELLGVVEGYHAAAD